MSGFTRRSFFQGLGGLTVGLLFSRKLERVLGELEAESLADEPQAPGQAPSAATITVAPQHAFRPDRLVIMGTAIGTRMVPVKKFVPCAVCDKRDEWGDHRHDRAMADR